MKFGHCIAKVTRMQCNIYSKLKVFYVLKMKKTNCYGMCVANRCMAIIVARFIVQTINRRPILIYQPIHMVTGPTRASKTTTRTTVITTKTTTMATTRLRSIVTITHPMASVVVDITTINEMEHR